MGILKKIFGGNKSKDRESKNDTKGLGKFNIKNARLSKKSPKIKKELVQNDSEVNKELINQSNELNESKSLSNKLGSPISEINKLIQKSSSIIEDFGGKISISSPVTEVDRMSSPIENKQAKPLSIELNPKSLVSVMEGLSSVNNAIVCNSEILKKLVEIKQLEADNKTESATKSISELESLLKTQKLTEEKNAKIRQYNEQLKLDNQVNSKDEKSVNDSDQDESEDSPSGIKKFLGFAVKAILAGLAGEAIGKLIKKKTQSSKDGSYYNYDKVDAVGGGLQHQVDNVGVDLVKAKIASKAAKNGKLAEGAKEVKSFFGKMFKKNATSKATEKVATESTEVASKNAVKFWPKLQKVASKFTKVLPKGSKLGSFITEAVPRIGKMIPKMASKLGTRLVPGIGGAVGAATSFKGAVRYAKERDWVGMSVSALSAILSALSAAAAAIPAFGPGVSSLLGALSMAPDLGLMARDIWQEVEAVNSSKETAKALEEAQNSGIYDPENENDEIATINKSFGDSPTARQALKRDQEIKKVLELKEKLVKAKEEAEAAGIQNETEEIIRLQDQIKDEIEKTKKWANYTDQTSAMSTNNSFIPPVSYGSGTPDIDAAVDSLKSNIENRSRVVGTNGAGVNSPSNKSTGYCAKYVRVALANGGFLPNKSFGSASGYAGILPQYGFAQIPDDEEPIKGDISVESSTLLHPHGHIAMYDGTQWISDFKQKSINVHSRGQGTIHKYRYIPKTKSTEANNVNEGIPSANKSAIGDTVPTINENQYQVPFSSIEKAELGGDLVNMTERPFASESSTYPKFEILPKLPEPSENSTEEKSKVANNPTVVRGGDTVVNRGGDVYNDNRQYITNIVSDNAAASELS